MAYVLFARINSQPGLPGPAVYPVPSQRHSMLHPRLIHLYFADGSNSYLSAETREVIVPDDPCKSGRTIIEALIEGPRKDLIRTLPDATHLRSFFLTEDGTAYVDFNTAIKENHPGGSESELMTIYSVVNSLILNIDQIHSVKILIEGQEALTLAGHLDLRFPFDANMLLIR